ncbi:histidine kinase CKI1 [Manihot esculenta]|uniref:Uncharacterized protein n=1 Tax=Manihot esculenta TaxID=3983 RepID=A0ACB7H5I0_MANES|nr:histidine kinase CKI1 [Manihot esculenta]XP_043815532.1 histidine kinase CKI1 [Manihot esculenta]XP_043815533.1 histidine kinase CKI1 [Manihot esculenta]XP_043815534.1 histidine kinase CKI1 [Manihot esculenta]XP_043815535.1 histidine kinase CKI1 [Manihot esculenta]KAG8647108.1 hypothetical protein MANES_09G059305v8 [Manihot esculenta]
MKFSSLIASQLFIFILLAIGALLLPCIVIPSWYKIVQHMKEKVDLNASMLRSGLLFQIENTAKLLLPINSSTANLARTLSSSLNGSDLSQFDLQNKVAPILFQTISIIPHISQISYIGLEGNIFAYYVEGNQTFAMYSNSTASSNSSSTNKPMKYTCYKQPVDTDTGRLYGDASESWFNILANASWIQEALASSNGYASLGNGWNTAHDLLFLNSITIHGQGVISLGFPVKALISFFLDIDLYGGSLYLVAQNGEVLANGLPNTEIVVIGKSVFFSLFKPNGDQIIVGDVSCVPNNGVLRPSILNIGETKYRVFCSPLQIVGVQSVYALAFPYNGFASNVHRSTKIALILLMVMIAAVFISILSFVLLMVRAATREIYLCSALIKQMEATQQAERKSMNKSLAFARASHDIRAALAGITGLIEMSYEEACPGSELEINLHQMDDCAKDLVDLLNSILDTSKMEAGKMQVDSEEFDLAHLLEDVVDLFHPVGMRSGVDVVLDPYDGTVLKFSQVKGDRGKLRQVLCNLLSNAVKFTSEGHVLVRAWARKPGIENKIIASNRNGFWKHLSCKFTENKEDNDVEAMNSVKQNPNCMEFVFEVDDTGKGIPKEKQRSVFENFVQVKETTLGQGGTGLGLGIVQSLVRLMGGDIKIVDKENREKGTCFRFNTFLIASAGSRSTSNTMGDIETGFCNTHQYSVSTPRLKIWGSSPWLSKLGSSPKTERSHVVLMIQTAERRRIVHKFMESLGIEASVVRKWEWLHSALTKIKSEQNVSPYNSSERSDFGSRSEISSSTSKDVPLSALDGIEERLPSQRSAGNFRRSPSFILLVIDTSAGPFQELYGAVTEFRRGLRRCYCKVVWLDKPTSRSINPGSLEEYMIHPHDDILLKPFHGSRLFQAIKLLPEFGGTMHHRVSSAITKGEFTYHGGKFVRDPGTSSTMHSRSRKRSSTVQYYGHSLPLGEGSSRRGKHRKPRHYLARRYSVGSSEIEVKQEEEKVEEFHCNQSNDKPLSGLRFMVAEDNSFLRNVAMINLSRLGASVELCQNGEEALQLVLLGLQEQRKHEAYSTSPYCPYDYILMDCEMPVMNGYEATRQIREEERSYNIHIPIVALTAHTSGEDWEKMRNAGMDYHLCKPLRRESLLEAIRHIHDGPAPSGPENWSI